MEFFCSFSDVIHFTKEPMILSNCGHYICMDCYLKASFEHLECTTCGEMNQTISISLLSIGDSISKFEKQLRSRMNKLKSNLTIFKYN